MVAGMAEIVHLDRRRARGKDAGPGIAANAYASMAHAAMADEVHRDVDLEVAYALGDVAVGQRAHVVKRVEGRHRAGACDGVRVGAERDAGDLELRAVVPLDQAGHQGSHGAAVEVRRQVGDAQLVVVARRRDDERSLNRGNAFADIMARAGELLRQRAVIVQQRGRRDDRGAVADVDFELMLDLGGPRPVAQLGHAQSEAVEDRGEGHPQHQGPLVAFERGCEVAERHQRVAAPAMRLGVVRRQQERRVEAVEGLLVLPERAERDAAIEQHARAGGANASARS